MGNLNLFPIVQGSSNVYKITRAGRISVFASGFTNVTGVAFDNHGWLYVLESTVGAPFPAPGMGEIVRVDKHGNREVIATGLSFPTAMTFGPDGKLYVSNWGFGGIPGQGQIVQISFKCEEVHGDDDAQ